MLELRLCHLSLLPLELLSPEMCFLLQQGPGAFYWPHIYFSTITKFAQVLWVDQMTGLVVTTVLLVRVKL